MPELENIIESVMSSPESMGKIMELVKMFGGEEPKKDEKAPKEEINLPVTGGQMPGLDPEMITKIMSLLSQYNADGDRRISLLSAMRPYIRSEDGFHIDRAIHIVKLSHVAKSLFENFLK